MHKLCPTCPEKIGESSTGGTMTSLSQTKPDPPHCRRINGWQCPWDVMQALSWITIPLMCGVSILITLPLPHYPIVPILIGTFYGWNVLLVLILTSKLKGRNIVGNATNVSLDMITTANGLIPVLDRETTEPFRYDGGVIILDSVSWTVASVICILCYATVFGFTAHLLNFHFMLLRTGLTTISYIQQKRQMQITNAGKPMTQRSIPTISANVPTIIVLAFCMCLQFVSCRQRLPPSQYVATCFPGCHCNATVVECVGLGESNTQLFRHVAPQIYPKLDTLVVTGNQFGVLEDENLFGGTNDRHKQLTLVNLSNNAISSLGAQSLIGMPRVEYLYLSNNRLESVQDEPFNFMTSLKYLDLSRVFGKHISVKAKADLLRQMFKNNHSFIDLQEVILSGNELGFLHRDTFCNVKGLMRLKLDNNQLTTFDFDPNCFANLPSLDSIDVSKNPLKCDCDLREFHVFAIDEVNDFLNQDATTCASPLKLRGKKFFELDTVDLCRYGGGLWRWILLILFAAGVIIGYYRFCREIDLSMAPNWIKEKWNHARNSQLRVPLMTDSTGYSQLKETHENQNDRHVEPAFV
ncbi:leucine rich repeat domain-containing protein [Ditylenchus destructor]|uniref:Leucine rich repeat domain-containing protein n=1 Tax=Ditylenchus destructor TaxID=166010 RepID=A0AAD4N955_9BILA|nr:leucine rich repeat domain-containing protein [Ditylenchus destructor]